MSIEIIIAARGGDSSAFIELTDAYSPLIETMTDKYIRSIRAFGADRDDLRQEASVAFYRAVMTYDTEQTDVSFGLYAKICIRNRLISLLRSVKKKARISARGLDGNGVSSKERFLGGNDLGDLSKALLSKREKMVFLMYADGKSYREISEQIGASEKSVDNALFRAKKKLRAHYLSDDRK